MQDVIPTLYSGVADGLASQTAPMPASGLTNSTTETILTNWLMPANLLRIGSVLTIQLTGVIAVPATAGTITLRMRFGGLVGTLAGTITNAKGTEAATTLAFRSNWTLTCRSVGTSGTIWVDGDFISAMAPLATATGGPARVSTNTAAIAINTTIQQTVDFTGQWSVAATTWILTTHQMLVSLARV